MIRRFPGVHALWPLAVASLVVLGAGSCSKKNTVAPGDDLEGVASPSQLVLWPTTPNIVDTWRDVGVENGRRGPSIDPVTGRREDVFIGRRQVYSAPAGTMQGMIFDFTRADAFQVYRRDGGRLGLLKDFEVGPPKRYLPGQADLFGFIDNHPVPGPAQDYIARGIVEGVITPLAPKTNEARVPLTFVPGEVTYTGPSTSDSLLSMSWTAYPGAAGYWVHLYRFTDQGATEKIYSGARAPLYLAVTRDYFLGFFPGNVTSYKIGDPLPAGALLATRQTLISGPPEYWLRVSAVGQDGQLLGITWATGDSLFQPFEEQGVSFFDMWPMGAVVENIVSAAPNAPAGVRTPALERSSTVHASARERWRIIRSPSGVQAAH